MLASLRTRRFHIQSRLRLTEPNLGSLNQQLLPRHVGATSHPVQLLLGVDSELPVLADFAALIDGQLLDQLLMCVRNKFVLCQTLV